MDLALLGRALRSDNAKRNRLAGAIAAVVGFTILDVRAESGPRIHHTRGGASAGSSVEWTAELMEDQPNELIVWRSVDGAAVPNTGSVRFTPTFHGGT